jgi:alpha-galactosidase
VKTPLTALATLAATVVIPLAPAHALPDGQALTPPMGFNNWNSTGCRAEFNESMVKGIADLFVSKGLRDAGYQYVNIDDCWALPSRAPNGDLVPDPARFPNGIKALAGYVHSKGLKFGLYTSAGTKTCDTAEAITAIRQTRLTGSEPRRSTIRPATGVATIVTALTSASSPTACAP